MEVTYTNHAAQSGVNILLYGPAGSGKTYALRTIPKLMIISAEGGMLSLADREIPVLEVRTQEDVEQALAAAHAWTDYDTVAIDSISEVSDVVLASQMELYKDGRQAYGQMQDYMRGLLRKFRDLPKNVVMTAKTGESKAWDGSTTYGPLAAGQKMTTEMPYLPDEVLCLRLMRQEDGTVQRWIQTYPDGFFTCKDRSGRLDPYEAPDLGAIINKIAAPAVVATQEETTNE